MSDEELTPSPDAAIDGLGAMQMVESPLSGESMVEETPAPLDTPPVLVDPRTCVVCGRTFAAASRERCETRPDWCVVCCPHESCHQHQA